MKSILGVIIAALLMLTAPAVMSAQAPTQPVSGIAEGAYQGPTLSGIADAPGTKGSGFSGIADSPTTSTTSGIAGIADSPLGPVTSGIAEGPNTVTFGQVYSGISGDAAAAYISQLLASGRSFTISYNADTETLTVIPQS